MRNLLEQIEKALDLKLYYLALYTTLTIPDICGAMSTDKEKKVKKRYVEWFNKYVSHKYGPEFTAEDCYYYRCSILHQGSSEHEKSQYSRILFIEPGATKSSFHKFVHSHPIKPITEEVRDKAMKKVSEAIQGGKLKEQKDLIDIVEKEIDKELGPERITAIQINLEFFCRDIIEGAKTWLNDNEGTELYETNYQKFARLHPDGLKPYIVGIPVIS